MSGSSPLRIGLDLRYLQQALRNAPVGGIGGGIGGIGIFSRNLWRGLSALVEAEAPPSFRLVALLDYGPVTEDLRQMIGTAEKIRFGLIGRSALATRLARSSYSWVVSALETRLGVSALSGRVDIVHTLDQRPPVKGVATSVVTVHDRGAPSANPILRALSEPWQGIAKADAVAYDSEATRLDLADRLDARAGSRAIHLVIPLGIDLGQLRPRDLPAADIAARTGRFRPYFLHVGNCIGRKNPTGLLEAFRHAVVEGGVDADLVMVGPYHLASAGAAELHRLATAHGIADRLIVLDAVEQEQLTLLYNGALALVFPSLFEGFGLPIIEALACGTVPIVSNRSSLPEAAGPHGVLVDPTDPRDIARAMIDLTLHPRKAPEGVAWARRFSISRMARDYLALYRDLALSDARPRH